MKEIKFLHKIEYTNKNTVSTIDIANSLIANEFLVKSIKEGNYPLTASRD